MVEKKTTAATGLEIAVIGMAGRFPGANNIHEFWENIKNGVETVAFISPQELEEYGVPADVVNHPHYVKTKGGVLERMEYFDAFFFDYSPAEATLMDPQIRLFHECAWEALEDAGYDPLEYEHNIGLYAGSAPGFYWESQVVSSYHARELGDWETLHLAEKDFLTTRVSHRLDLKGPAVVVQTACSTSLTAIHMASRALLTGECQVALAGGVTVIPSPKTGYIYQKGMTLSPDGHCRSFDARSKGYPAGDGIGIVVLKPQEQAVREGDHIYAVIKGSAANNDGRRRVGFTAPSVSGQAEAIRTALLFARVEPQTIGYIEAHGTGTPLGDPIEIEALKKAFNTPQKKFCALGTVKSNLGHLGAAAGAAGFIKTVMILKHQCIPPSLHFETPNPNILFRESPFFVNTRLRKWKPGNFPRRAGVSSFGIGGTNVHVVLEEWPPVSESVSRYAGESVGQRVSRGGSLCRPTNSQEYQLLLLSAKTPGALQRITENLAEYFREDPTINLADAAYTTKVGRRAFRYRGMVTGSTIREVVTALSSPEGPKMKTSRLPGEEKPKQVIFMFPGLGSQYVNMGLPLYENEKIFRQQMDRCFHILNPLMGDDIEEILYPSPVSPAVKNSKINQVEIAHPLVFAFEYALAKLLIHWGIQPYAMIGYSFGEYTAACLSGVFSLEDALRLVVCRGKLLEKIPPGMMLSVPMDSRALKPLLESFNPGLSLAIDNGSTCVVTGLAEIAAAFEKEMKRSGYMCMRIPSTRPVHSPLVELIVKQYEETVRKITLHKPQIPYISNVTGQWLKEEDALSSRYWSKHLRETVQFGKGMKELEKIKNSIWVEIGPGRDLTIMASRFIDKTSHQKVLDFIPPVHENPPPADYFSRKLGYLWLYGVKVDWKKFYAGQTRQRVSLPTYCFEPRRFTIEPSLPSAKESAPVTALSPAASEIKTQVALKKVEVPTPAEENKYKFLYERPEFSSEYIPPATEIERKLAFTWQNFFAVQRIGIDDKFFELGGDSLKASIILPKISKELDIDIPMDEFFKNPTIRGLALLIKNKIREKHQLLQLMGGHPREVLKIPQHEIKIKGEEIEREMKKYLEEPVVLLNRIKPEKIFCFPPGIAYGAVYKTLAHLVDDYSWYSFCFIEHDNRLKKYVEIIIHLQPQGPYILFGYSAAGKLTFEVANALENEGYKVSAIILADSFWPEKGGEGDEGGGKLADYAEKYLEDLGMIKLKRKIKEKMREYKAYWSNLTRPKVVNANVHLILSQQNKTTDRAGCWDEFTTGSTALYQGFGQHGEMLTADFAEKNAKITREILNKIRDKTIKNIRNREK